jgi:hypothetical protein
MGFVCNKVMMFFNSIMIKIVECQSSFGLNVFNFETSSTCYLNKYTNKRRRRNWKNRINPIQLLDINKEDEQVSRKRTNRLFHHKKDRFILL